MLKWLSLSLLLASLGGEEGDVDALLDVSVEELEQEEELLPLFNEGVDEGFDEMGDDRSDGVDGKSDIGELLHPLLL